MSWGQYCSNYDCTWQLMDNLDFKAATEEIKTAAGWLREQGAPKVGVTGFCMGGALTFLGAEYAGVDACAPFYGTPPAELGHVRNSTCSIRLTLRLLLHALD